MLRSVERCLPPPVKKCIPAAEGEGAAPPPKPTRDAATSYSHHSEPRPKRTPPVYPGLATLRLCALLLNCVAAGCGTVGALRLEETSLLHPSPVVSLVACVLALHGAWLALLLSRAGALKPKVMSHASTIDPAAPLAAAPAPPGAAETAPPAAGPTEQPPDVRLTHGVSPAAPGTNQLVELRYPASCFGRAYEEDYGAACVALRAVDGEYALLHDFRLTGAIDPWALLKDAVAIAREARLSRVGFVLADFGPWQNALIRRTLVTFCPAQPARVFLDPDAARAWALTPSSE